MNWKSVVKSVKSVYLIYVRDEYLVSSMLYIIDGIIYYVSVHFFFKCILRSNVMNDLRCLVNRHVSRSYVRYTNCE